VTSGCTAIVSPSFKVDVVVLGKQMNDRNPEYQSDYINPMMSARYPTIMRGKEISPARI